jgi:hypothetical protein
VTIVGELIGVPSGHVAGVPVEETLAPFVPVLVAIGGVAIATFRARVRRVRRVRGELDLEDPRDAAPVARDRGMKRLG